MEPIAHGPHTIKGTEVLFFEDAEITKMKGDQKSFAASGSLSVLYFKDFNRFVLQINDWRYPLLRRLNTTSSGDGCYTLPAMNGFTYKLKVNNAGQGLKNLDALLEGTRKLEKSPEDKLLRENLHRKETGTKEVITQTLNQILHKVHNKASTFKIGTKHLTSTRKRTNLKDIKNKNFKKEAHSKIKKDFFKSSEKLSNEFLQKRRDNVNMTQARDLDALKKSDGATMYLPREEIEETILLGKDIFALSSPMDPTLSKPAEKKGLMGSLKEGMQNVKDTLRGGERHANTGAQTEKMPVSAEGMTHYQG